MKDDPFRPHGDRRRHQQLLARQRRQRRKRRRARVRRLRFLRGLRTAKFWSSFATYMLILILVVFWAKFAFVYDIPAYAQRGPLVGVQDYVTTKPWWFGPPIFDIQSYSTPPAQDLNLEHPYQFLVESLGRYQDVLIAPQFVWMQRQ